MRNMMKRWRELELKRMVNIFGDFCWDEQESSDHDAIRNACLWRSGRTRTLRGCTGVLCFKLPTPTYRHSARVIALSPYLSPPRVRTKRPCIASKMPSTKQDVGNNQKFLNACVTRMFMINHSMVTHFSSSSPFAGPPASQSAGRGYVNPFFCPAILVKNHPGIALLSPNRTEDHPLGNALRSQVCAYQ